MTNYCFLIDYDVDEIDCPYYCENGECGLPLNCNNCYACAEEEA